MATTQTTLITEGQTAVTSAAVTIPSGATYVFGIYSSSASSIPSNVGIQLVAVTPGGNRTIVELTGHDTPISVTGPVDVKGVRPDISAQGVNVGLYYNS